MYAELLNAEKPTGKKNAGQGLEGVAAFLSEISWGAFGRGESRGEFSETSEVTFSPERSQEILQPVQPTTWVHSLKCLLGNQYKKK